MFSTNHASSNRSLAVSLSRDWNYREFTGNLPSAKYSRFMNSLLDKQAFKPLSTEKYDARCIWWSLHSFKILLCFVFSPFLPVSVFLFARFDRRLLCKLLICAQNSSWTRVWPHLKQRPISCRIYSGLSFSFLDQARCPSSSVKTKSTR